MKDWNFSCKKQDGERDPANIIEIEGERGIAKKSSCGGAEGGNEQMDDGGRVGGDDDT